MDISLIHSNPLDIVVELRVQYKREKCYANNTFLRCITAE